MRAKACACAPGMLLAISVQPALAVVPVDPGDYTRLPGGTDLLLTYYQHLTADDFYVNGDKVLDNLDLTLDVGFIRYLHYFAVGDWLIVPDVILPFSRQEIDLTGQTLSGLGDLTFGTTFSPLLDLKNKHQFGVTLWLTAPTGEEKNQGLALSNNRWTYELQAGYIGSIAPRWTIDLVADVEGYQDQRETGLEQDPVFQGDAMVRYHISDTTHVALSYRHTWGGETTLNGVTQTGNLNNDTVIFTWASFLSKQWQLQLQWRQDVNIEEGPRIQGIQTRLLYLF